MDTWSNRHAMVQKTQTREHGPGRVAALLAQLLDLPDLGRRFAARSGRGAEKAAHQRGRQEPLAGRAPRAVETVSGGGPQPAAGTAPAVVEAEQPGIREEARRLLRLAQAAAGGVSGRR